MEWITHVVYSDTVEVSAPNSELNQRKGISCNGATANELTQDKRDRTLVPVALVMY